MRNTNTYDDVVKKVYNVKQARHFIPKNIFLKYLSQW